MRRRKRRFKATANGLVEVHQEPPKGVIELTLREKYEYYKQLFAKACEDFEEQKTRAERSCRMAGDVMQGTLDRLEKMARKARSYRDRMNSAKREWNRHRGIFEDEKSDEEKVTENERARLALESIRAIQI